MKKDEYIILLRRIFAWSTDWLFFMFLFINIAYVASFIFPFVEKAVTVSYPLLFIAVATLFSVLCENITYAVFGTTLGKHLTGLKIVSEKENFVSAGVVFKRGWLFFVNCLGMGVAFVMLLSIPVSFFFYKKHKSFEWDKKYSVSVISSKRSAVGWFVTFLSVALFWSVSLENPVWDFAGFTGFKGVENELGDYRADAVRLINDPFIENGKLIVSPVEYVFMANSILKRGFIIQNRIEKILNTEEKIVSGTEVEEKAKISRQKQKLNSFFSYIKCALLVKNDIISYLYDNSDDFFEGKDGIEFKHGDTRYFFELRLSALNSCTVEFEKEVGNEI